jgi:hypothetical protein
MADRKDKITNKPQFSGPIKGPVYAGIGDQINVGQMAKEAIVGDKASSSADARIDVDGNVVVVEPDTSRVVEKLSQRTALERITNAASEDLSQLTQTYNQTRHQSEQWTRFSILAALLGFLILMGGIIAMFLGYTSAGLVTSAVGFVSEVAAGLFFRQLTKANDRVDDIRAKLTEAQGIQRAMDFVAATVNNDETQNRLVETILLHMLGQSTKGQAISKLPSSHTLATDHEEDS